MALCPAIWCRNYNCHFSKPDAHWATLNSSVLYGTLPRVTVLKSSHLKKNPDNPILLRTLDMHCYSGPNTDVSYRYPRNGNAYLIFIMVVFFLVHSIVSAQIHAPMRDVTICVNGAASLIRQEIVSWHDMAKWSRDQCLQTVFSN